MAASDSSPTMWTSRSGFLLAAVGGAVGLGNLWRFPYIAGENGGGGFVLIYLGFVFVIGLPLIAGELLLGRRGRGSAIHAIANLVKSENAHPFWNIIGWLSLLIPFIALSYYAVVAAWAIDYLVLAASNVFATLDPAKSGEFFAARVGNPTSQILLHAAFIASTVWVVSQGLNGGIERMSKILMPGLFGVILVLVIYNMFNGAFGAAVDFLFKPDFSEITGASVLMALGQALFSLAVGVGLMITYAAYMPSNYSIRRSAIVICVGDTLVALLAGLAIFPIVFANNLDPAGGPGLIFVTLPIAFGQMPGGQIIGALFFILLLFAAYTSAVGMLEPIVSRLEEKWPGRRKLLTPCAGAAVWVAGIGSVLSYGVMADVHPLGFLGIERTFFDLADYTIANVLLPINAFLIAVFAGWVIKRSTVDEEFSNSTNVWKSFWRFANRYIAPIAIAIVLLDLLTGFSQDV
jgi:NSS family neurotransmitter:Na+ symporter